MSKTTVGEWLERNFLAWQSQQGERKTVEAFAEWIGVHRVSLSRWMNTDRLPDADYADQIADKLGPEIYDLLDMPRPDPRLQAIIKQWGNLPESVKDELLSRAETETNRGQTSESTHSTVAPAKRKQKT